MHRFLGLLSLAAPLACAEAGPAAAPAWPRTVSAHGVSGELRPGSTCDGIGAPVALVLGKSVDRRGSSLVTSYRQGCGCPTGPVFTMLFDPATSPLEVRLCQGPGTDACEAMCSGELVWDLADAMRAAGARDLRLVD